MSLVSTLLPFFFHFLYWSYICNTRHAHFQRWKSPHQKLGDKWVNEAHNSCHIKFINSWNIRFPVCFQVRQVGITSVCFNLPLRKHAYSTILKILPLNKWKFSDKNSDIFHISAQNIDCGYTLEPPRRGGSNEYPQSMFWAEIRKIIYTPVNPSFTI